MKKIIILLFIFASLFTFATKKPVPSMYSTIQLALNACAIGDTVLVQPGTYTENLVWPNTQNIKLISAGDSSNTIIDANFVGRCITITNTITAFIDTNTVISGFKLRNGYSDTCNFTGVAIYVNFGSPLLKNLAITNCNVNAANTTNTLGLTGGVIYMVERGIIKNCSFYNNSVYNAFGSITGGLIYIDGNGANPGTAYGNIYNTRIFNNKIRIKANSISGALILGGIDINKLTVINNTVNDSGSTAGAVMNGLVYIPKGTIHTSAYSEYHAVIKSSLIANNIFSSNTIININSIGIFYKPSGGGCTVNRCYVNNITIANNKVITTGTISTLSFFRIGTPFSCSGLFVNLWADINNCIFYNPLNSTTNEISQGGGPTGVTLTNANFTTNPQFVSPTDFHLQSTSPAINTGTTISTINPYNPTTDIEFNSIPMPFGSNRDIGCYEMNQPATFVTTANSSSLNVCAGTMVTFTNTTPQTKSIYWSSPNVVNTSTANTYAINTPTAGTYIVNVTVVDSSYAVGSNSYIVTVLPSPTPTISPLTNICLGQSATLTANSSNTVSSYLWYDGSTTQSIVITPTVSSTYSVVLQNGYGCSAIGNASINVYAYPPTPTITASSYSICYPQNLTLSTNVSSLVSAYLWSTGATSQSITLVPSASASYSLSVQNNGCFALSNIISVNVYSYPNPTITASNASICLGQSVNLNVTSTNTISSYLWFDGSVTQSVVVTPTASNNYTVTVDNNGCFTWASIYINVSICTNIKSNFYAEELSIFPNPNSGILTIELKEFKDYVLKIVNTLGQVIQTNNLVNQTTQLNVNQLSNGIYFLQIYSADTLIGIKKIIKE